MKSGDYARSGGTTAVAPRDLTHASWVFAEPLGKSGHALQSVFHQSPILDADANTYITSSSGWVYSLDSDGKLRWQMQLSSTAPGNLALLDGILYAASKDGYASSIDPSNGNLRWHTKVGNNCPEDTYSLLAAKGLLIVPTVQNLVLPGNGQLVAVNLTDGSVKWTYNLEKHFTHGYNIAPALLGDDQLVFTDAYGGFYRLSIEDGNEELVVKPPKPDSGGNFFFSLTAGFTTAGAPAFFTGPRPEGVKGTPGSTTAFVASNPWKDGRSLLRAMDVKTGEVIWSRSDLGGVFAAPALGTLGLDGKLVLAVLVGPNPGPPPPKEKSTVDKLKELFHLQTPSPDPIFKGSVVLLDAWTGATRWSMDTPVEHTSTCANNTWDNPCFPDGWGAASIGGDGTVYANWSGGWVWALNDANLDGVLDANDPQEVSGYQHGGGANSNPAVAPGLLVVSSCWRVMGFKS